MKEQEFLSWMLDSGYNRSKIMAFLASCKRIEEFEGSIDEHFKVDRGRNLLRKFRYSAKEQDYGSPQHAVPIERDAVKETDALKKALKFYLDFLTCTEQKAVLKYGDTMTAARKIYAKKQRGNPSDFSSTFANENESYYSQFKPRRDEAFVGKKLFVGKLK
jgi:hypothetical protein